VELNDVDARPDLLDAEQIAAELRVNVKTVRRWQADGDLPSTPIGRRRLTRRAWLEQFIDDRANR
jgi:excisionase family DNA binding protein